MYVYSGFWRATRCDSRTCKNRVPQKRELRLDAARLDGLVAGMKRLIGRGVLLTLTLLMASPGKPAAGEEERISKMTSPQQEAAEKAKFAKLLAHLEPLGDRSAVRQVGIVSSMVNVFPGEPPKAEQMQAEVVLTAARREHESAQIVLSAGPEPLSVERVEVSDLCRVGGAGTIAADHVEVPLVGYTYVDKSSYRGKRLGVWPDPLLRLQPFTCPPGQARSLWVTLQVPENAIAGTYTGNIRVFSDDRLLTGVPVKLRVCNFTLPTAPRLHTSYWSHFSSLYDPRKEEAILDDAIRMFGAYRVSTSVFQPGDVVWYREADGTITCEWDRMRRRLELAVASGFRTLNVGPGLQGNAGDSRILFDPVIDRATGKILDLSAAPENTPEARARAYLVPLANWLEEQGLLDRACLQIRDEESNRGSWSSFLAAVKVFRAVEPRIKLLSVLALHPIHQGWFDIASPHLFFCDLATYRMLRDGVSLYGPKNFAARVTASATGGRDSGAFYRAEPEDAYDGCDYTTWEPPNINQSQWLRFDFDKLTLIDGIRTEPAGNITREEATWVCEGSTDGVNFRPLLLTQRGRDGKEWSFERSSYKAIRLIWRKGRAEKPVVDEVEFLRRGLPLEATQPRKRVQPIEVWEYQIGPSPPAGVTIDTEPLTEIRATGWVSWLRGNTGYLNYGAAQWSNIYAERPCTQDPLVWTTGRDDSGPGSAMIVYPGKDEVLPSVRLARFRDGMDDFDYLTLLAERSPNHPLLAKIRRSGGDAYNTALAIEANRLAVSQALERLGIHGTTGGERGATEATPN